MSVPEKALQPGALTGSSITITLKQLQDSRQALYRLAALTLRLSMSVRVRKVLREVEPINELCDARQKALIESYANENQARGIWEYKGEDVAEKNATRLEHEAAWAGELKEEVTLAVPVISADELESAIVGEGGLSGSDLYMLGWLIKE